MVSIRQLNKGDTVHVLLRHGYPLKHSSSAGAGEWNVVVRKGGSKQAQNELTNFVGTVAAVIPSKGILKLYGGGGTGQGIHQSMASGKTAGVGLATIPWNFIWKAWRIVLEPAEIVVSTHGPNPPGTVNENSVSRSRILKEKIDSH